MNIFDCSCGKLECDCTINSSQYGSSLGDVLNDIINAKIKNVRNTVNDNIAKVAGIGRKVDKVADKMDSLEKYQARNSDLIDAFKYYINELQEKVAKLETELKKLQK
jgi:peptidoglycan hydrolase CwlO-like protein